MQVALKEDLDALKEKFRTMESNQKTSFQEIPKLNEDLLQKQKQLEQIETGELGLNKIWINITEINKQVSLLTSTVNHLKTSIKSASDLIILPVTVEKLQKTVANIGSTLTSVSHDVENLQTAIEEYKKSIEALQNDVELKQMPSLPSIVTPSTQINQTENCKQESQSLHTVLEELNNTAVMYQKLNDIKLLHVDSAIGNLSQRVTLLESSLVAVNNLDKRDNSSTSVENDVTTSLNVEKEDQLNNGIHSDKELKETGIRNSQVLKLKEELQMITALSVSKSANDGSAEASTNVGSSTTATAKPTDLPRLTSRSADDNRENQQLRRLSLPGVSSIQDLQNWFEKATGDADGKLSYEDLQKLLDFTVEELQSFKKFDADGDEKYSLQELRLALGV
ncbi:PREDICTED: EF-hand calcium-binding domain-containing protein 14 [Tinamus guttatus]|uniref:EF-hand calcium-binding domain-containing protein 14 n=1 Tax=Tinamus guttatus TaxID=94827 RepID=UPI00052EDCF5|nr:PREDICTED: EF-hand calcium-binding domain-containing protein 14 [Tinamus guttatus]